MKSRFLESGQTPLGVMQGKPFEFFLTLYKRQPKNAASKNADRCNCDTNDLLAVEEVLFLSVARLLVLAALIGRHLPG